MTLQRGLFLKTRINRETLGASKRSLFLVLDKIFTALDGRCKSSEDGLVVFIWFANMMMHECIISGKTVAPNRRLFSSIGLK